MHCGRTHICTNMEVFLLKGQRETSPGSAGNSNLAEEYELLDEEQLILYLSYWGTSKGAIRRGNYPRGRELAVLTFYCLHHPEGYPEGAFWVRCIHEAVTFLWNWLHHPGSQGDEIFRTAECKLYFQKLLDGYVNLYGKIAVFQYRYQNWAVVHCPTMIDQLWTVMEQSDLQTSG